MSLFVLGDTHLSFGVPEKPMDIFSGWANYQQLLEENWRRVIQPEDTIVLAGDLSWGMNLEEAKADFAFLQSLPGTKIILKGNHDYWWNSMKKMTGFFEENGFDSLHILHNNCYPYEGYGICGTRGWVNMPGEAQDAKILAREQQRLQVSLQAAVDQNLTPIVFLHYPPIFWSNRNEPMLEVMHAYGVRDCYYGHLHGKSHNRAVKGEEDGIHYHLISGDYLQFMPEKVL
ncbi:MAG: metallophosphoesterase [Oscillospiraceae bacterium]|nr:metallophosphoesterase [Oscillospiraceae bacterium]MBQ7012730.1 metallophosphoesterase [Oscillospiraceae bacterium]